MGFNNYKYFILHLIYAIFTLIFIEITYSKCLTDTILNIKVSDLLAFYLIKG